MSITEKIRRIVNANSQNDEHVSLSPTSKLRSVIDRSKILGLFEHLIGTPIETTKEIVENGKKMIIVAKWGKEPSSSSQIIISVTESSISFIGSDRFKQYIRLEGKNMRDSKKIDESLKNTFSKPQIINS